MSVHGSWTLEALVAGHVKHLRHAHGLRESSIQRYEFYARRFVSAVLGDDLIDVAQLRPQDVVEFILSAKGRLRPRTVGLVATSLRSFLRYLRLEGLCDGRLEAAVPRVAQWRGAALPRGLSDEQLAQLLTCSARSSTPCARRDHAILHCLSGLGLRPCEVADLRLDDIDWRAGTLHVRAHKTRRDGALPLPRDVGAAIVAYLRTERPATSERRVFVQRRRAALGEPVGRLAVTHAVDRALRRAGVQAPNHGAYVLRHTFASRLVRRRTSIKEVADLLGHRSLDTTAIYAKLDVPALREVALPWPEVTP